MSVYTKLNQAREQFHGLKLEKTGKNTFANYKYFELGDFLIPALRVFKEVGLCAVVSFDKEVATMHIVDVETNDSLVIKSPMGSAALKGCHEVQNIGAVETYQRRYLWVAALEIVEHDALDATTGSEKKAGVIAPTGTPLVDPSRMSLIADVADAVKQHMASDDTAGAYEEATGLTDPEERTQLWKKLDSKTRSALKKYADSVRESAATSRV